MAFNKLIDILNQVHGKYPQLSLRLREAEGLGRWNLAVGELIAKHSRAVRVRDSILFVEVDHPIWRSELHYRKQQILEILNRVRGPKEKSEGSIVIQDIVFLDPRNYAQND